MSLFSTKKRIVLALTFLLFFSSSFLFSDDDSVAKVTSLKGKAWITQKNRVRKKVNLGMGVHNGDTLNTAKESFMQLTLMDNSKMNMIGEAELKIDLIVFNEKTASARMDLEGKKGLIQFFGGKISEIAPSSFRLKTSNATIGIQGSQFNVNISEDGVKFYGSGASIKVKLPQVERLLKAAASAKKAGNKQEAKEGIKNALALFVQEEGNDTVPALTPEGEFEVRYVAGAGAKSTVVTEIKLEGLSQKVINAPANVVVQQEVTQNLGPGMWQQDMAHAVFHYSEKVDDVVEGYNEAISQEGDKLQNAASNIMDMLDDDDVSLDDVVDQMTEFVSEVVEYSEKINDISLELQETILRSIDVGDDEQAQQNKDALLSNVEKKKELNREVADQKLELISEFSESPEKLDDIIKNIKAVDLQAEKSSLDLDKNLVKAQIEVLRDAGDQAEVEALQQELDTIEEKSSEIDSQIENIEAGTETKVQQTRTSVTNTSSEKDVIESELSNTQQQNTADANPLTDREKIEGLSSQGLIDNEGRGALTSSDGTTTFGSAYVFNDKADQNVISSQSLLSSFQGSDGFGTTPSSGAGSNTTGSLVYLEDGQDNAQTFDVDWSNISNVYNTDPSSTSSGSTGGTTDGNLHHFKTNKGNSSIVYIGGNTATAENQTGRTYYASHPSSEDVGSFSGNTATGGDFNLLPSSRFYTNVITDFDKEVVSLDSAYAEEGASNQLPEFFALGKQSETPSTLFYRPKGHRQSYLHMDAKLQFGVIDSESIRVFTPHGIMKDKDGNTIFFEANTLGSVTASESTAFYLDNSASGLPTGLAFDISFPTESNTDSGTTTAHITSSVYQESAPVDSKFELTSGVFYDIFSVGPALNSTNGSWKISSPYIAQGRMQLGSDGLEIDNLGFVAYQGSSAKQIGVIEGKEFRYFDAETFAGALQDRSNASPSSITNLSAIKSLNPDLSSAQRITLDASNSYKIGSALPFMLDAETNQYVSVAEYGFVEGRLNISDADGKFSIPAINSSFIAARTLPGTMSDGVYLGESQIGHFSTSTLDATNTRGVLGARVSTNSSDLQEIDLISLEGDRILASRGFLGADNSLYSRVWDEGEQKIVMQKGTTSTSFITASDGSTSQLDELKHSMLMATTKDGSSQSGITFLSTPSVSSTSSEFSTLTAFGIPQNNNETIIRDPLAYAGAAIGFTIQGDQIVPIEPKPLAPIDRPAMFTTQGSAVYGDVKLERQHTLGALQLSNSDTESAIFKQGAPVDLSSLPNKLEVRVHTQVPEFDTSALGKSASNQDKDALNAKLINSHQNASLNLAVSMVSTDDAKHYVLETNKLPDTSSSSPIKSVTFDLANDLEIKDKDGCPLGITTNKESLVTALRNQLVNSGLTEQQAEKYSIEVDGYLIQPTVAEKQILDKAAQDGVANRTGDSVIVNGQSAAAGNAYLFFDAADRCQKDLSPEEKMALGKDLMLLVDSIHDGDTNAIINDFKNSAEPVMVSKDTMLIPSAHNLTSVTGLSGPDVHIQSIVSDSANDHIATKWKSNGDSSFGFVNLGPASNRSTIDDLNEVIASQVNSDVITKYRGTVRGSGLKLIEVGFNVLNDPMGYVGTMELDCKYSTPEVTGGSMNIPNFANMGIASGSLGHTNGYIGFNLDLTQGSEKVGTVQGSFMNKGLEKLQSISGSFSADPSDTGIIGGITGTFTAGKMSPGNE